MDGVRNGDVFALGMNLECGVRANGHRDRAKTLDGGTLIDDMSATQCQVENNAWGYRSEMRRGQRWTRRENAVGWEDNWIMPYARLVLDMNWKRG